MSFGETLIETKEVTFEEGERIMHEAGYPYDMFVNRWREWLERGDIVLIFQNHDMGHPECGHVMTMPWYSDQPIPKHAPDHAMTGLGWRYLPAYKITS